jgi:ribosomal protein L23
LFKGFREILNGLYNELTNSISENITKNNISASVKKLCDIFVDSAQTTFGTYTNKRTGKIYNFKITKIFKKAWRTNIIVNNTRVSTS